MSDEAPEDEADADEAEAEADADEAEAEPVVLAPPAATGSSVWVAIVKHGFFGLPVGFSCFDDAEDWLAEQGIEDAQLFGVVVDGGHLTPEETLARLGVENGEVAMPYDDPTERFKAPVTKGQFVEELIAMGAEKQAELAWRLRQNYQRILAEVADVRETLEERLGSVEEAAATLGLDADDAEAFNMLLDAR